MDHDDRQQDSGERGEDAGYEAPKAEQIDSTEGPAVTSAGMTIDPV